MDGSTVKTTVEISDSVMREVRRLAAREGTTLKEVLERGLRRALTESREAAPFKLRRASFKGRGRRAEFEDASWETLRKAAYEGRGP